jgi:hypothetical protein
MYEVEIKKTSKTDNQYDLKIKGWTAGMVMSLKHALEASPSPVAADCLAFLQNAIDKNPELKAKIG